MAIQGSDGATDDERRADAVDQMLRAAVAARVSLPSDTLDRLGLSPPECDWRALNAFQARYPVEITHDERGCPLPPAVSVTHTPVTEAEDEPLRLTD